MSGPTSSMTIISTLPGTCVFGGRCSLAALAGTPAPWAAAGKGSAASETESRSAKGRRTIAGSGGEGWLLASASGHSMQVPPWIGPAGGELISMLLPLHLHIGPAQGGATELVSVDSLEAQAG